MIAHQSLEETHIFGLAVLEKFEGKTEIAIECLILLLNNLSDHHDEIFLEFDRKLVKYAPKGWDSNVCYYIC